MAQNLPGRLIRATVQSEKKNIWGQKQSGIPNFQLPIQKIAHILKILPRMDCEYKLNKFSDEIRVSKVLRGTCDCC